MFPIRDHNPSGTTPYLTIALIVINTLVFILTNVTQTPQEAERLAFLYGMIPARISAGQGYLTFVTSMFMHGSWLHLGGNMLFLWVFGDNLEDKLGKLGFLLFYFACGFAAAGAQYLTDPASRLPMIGASGAIAGVLGGYIWLFPRAKVDVVVIFVIFFRIFVIPAWIVLGFWFGAQVLAGALTPAGAGGVAHWAHIGGFAVGLGITALLFHHDPEPDLLFGPPPVQRQRPPKSPPKSPPQSPKPPRESQPPPVPKPPEEKRPKESGRSVVPLVRRRK